LGAHDCSFQFANKKLHIKNNTELERAIRSGCIVSTLKGNLNLLKNMMF